LILHLQTKNYNNAADVATLYHWLAAEPLGNIKAAPILAYYIDLKNSLQESFRILLKPVKKLKL